MVRDLRRQMRPHLPDIFRVANVAEHTIEEPRDALRPSRRTLSRYTCAARGTDHRYPIKPTTLVRYFVLRPDLGPYRFRRLSVDHIDLRPQRQRLDGNFAGR